LAGLAVSPIAAIVAASVKTEAGQQVLVWQPGEKQTWKLTHELPLEENLSRWVSVQSARVKFSPTGGISFSADGRYLAAAGMSGTVKVWDSQFLPGDQGFRRSSRGKSTNPLPSARRSLSTANGWRRWVATAG
jgi:WD40 repeat protein